jgi:hypothetical protein
VYYFVLVILVALDRLPLTVDAEQPAASPSRPGTQQAAVAR